MSRTTRSNSVSTPSALRARRVGVRSPTVRLHAGCGPPKNVSTLAARHVGEVLRGARTTTRSPGRRRPAAASRSAHPTRRRPRGPAHPGRGRRGRRSSPRPSGRRSSRRAASTSTKSVEQRAQRRGRRRPSSVVTTIALGAADEVVVLDDRPSRCGTACPRPSVMVCIRFFGSVSWTRSPSRSRPRRWSAPCGAGGEVTVGKVSRTPDHARRIALRRVTGAEVSSAACR